MRHFMCEQVNVTDEYATKKLRRMKEIYDSHKCINILVMEDTLPPVLTKPVLIYDIDDVDSEYMGEFDRWIGILEMHPTALGYVLSLSEDAFVDDIEHFITCIRDFLIEKNISHLDIEYPIHHGMHKIITKK